MEILFYIIIVFFVTSKVQIVIITMDFGKSSKILLVLIRFLQHVTSLQCIKLFLTCNIYMCLSQYAILQKATHNMLITAKLKRK